MGFYDNLGTGFNGQVMGIELSSSGDIFAIGAFDTFNGANHGRIVKLDSSGSLDTNFNTGTGFAPHRCYDVEIQSDNKILVAGFFSTYNETNTDSLVRLDTTGSLDLPFSASLGTGFNGVVIAIKIQPDGKILAGGYFNQFNGNSRNMLVRLNSDGTEDSDFNIGTGFDGAVESIEVQSDGKILVGGAFTSFNGNNRNALVRLDDSGSVDSPFSSSLGDFDEGIEKLPRVYSIKIQSDNKIIVTGHLYGLNGNNTYSIARLHPDGTEDTDFSAGVGGGLPIDRTYRALDIQSDGKILVGGHYGLVNSNFWYSGSAITSLIRIGTTGSLDLPFSASLGTGFNLGAISTIKVQPDGKILVGGYFTEFNGKLRNKLIRLNPDGTEDGVSTQLPNAFSFNGREMSYTVVNEVNIRPVEDVKYINNALLVDTKPPGTASNLDSSSVCQTQFTMSWTAPTDNDLAYYKLYRDPAGPTTQSFWGTVDGSQTSSSIGGLTPSASADWTLVSVDEAGNESPQATAITVVTGASVSEITMTPTGQSTSGGACAATANTTRYLGALTPSASKGDVIYTNACGTDRFNGGGNWFKFSGFLDDPVFQVDSNGVISNLQNC